MRRIRMAWITISVPSFRSTDTTSKGLPARSGPRWRTLRRVDPYQAVATVSRPVGGELSFGEDTCWSAGILGLLWQRIGNTSQH